MAERSFQRVLTRDDFPLALQFASFASGEMTFDELVRLAHLWAESHTAPLRDELRSLQQTEPGRRYCSPTHELFITFLLDRSRVHRSCSGSIHLWLPEDDTVDLRADLARLVGHLLLSHCETPGPSERDLIRLPSFGLRGWDAYNLTEEGRRRASKLWDRERARRFPEPEDDPMRVYDARRFAFLAVGGAASRDPSALPWRGVAPP